MKKISNVTDLPLDISLDQKDQFNIEVYSNALAKFIKNIAPPITIALQGEWGSGKTSLMKTLKYRLCAERNEFDAVWINTWQFSLMNDKMTAIQKILLNIYRQILSLNDEPKANFNEKTKKVLKAVGRFGMGVGLRFATAGNVGMEEVDTAFKEFWNDEGKAKDSEIEMVKNEISDLVKITLENNKKKGIIFFIDDLDRIDPPTAVEILELLKNVFDIEGCIFVLALDYDVVVKGLKPKFGELTKENEREFRSFFDKIIQVPFSMPVNNYDIKEFLRSSLEKTGFIDESFKEPKHLETLSDIANLSVGSNPRSLKRLINIISLLNIISNNENSEENTEDDVRSKILNFGLVCLQIAYPAVYNAIVIENDFTQWTDALLIKMDIPKTLEEDINKIKNDELFNDIWEQVLYSICQKDIYLKRNVTNISKLLNSLANIYADGGLKEGVENVIKLSAFTSIEENADKQKVSPESIHVSDFLKNIRAKVLPLVNEQSPADINFKCVQKRIESNLALQTFRNEKKYFDTIFRVHKMKDGRFNVRFLTGHYAKVPKKSEDVNVSISKMEHEEVKNSLLNGLKEVETYANSLNRDEVQLFTDWSETNYGCHSLYFYCDTYLDNPYDLFRNETLMKDFTTRVIKVVEMSTRIK